MFRAVGIKPEDSAFARQFFCPIVGKGPFDQIAPLSVAYGHAEEIVSCVPFLSVVEQRQKCQTLFLQSAAVAQVYVP